MDVTNKRSTHNYGESNENDTYSSILKEQIKKFKWFNFELEKFDRSFIQKSRI